MNSIFETVLLADGTTGKIDRDSLAGHCASDFIGEIVRARLHDENGMPIEVEGRLVEVLE